MMRSETIPLNWDAEADVVVVGGGNAGLPAAVTAREPGATVTIVEENKFLGGLMRGSGGYMFFCNTHVQRQLGIEDRVQWGAADEMIMSEYRAVRKLVQAYVAGGAETCQWLEDLGLTWAAEVRDGDHGQGADGQRAVARTHFAAASPTGYYPGGGALGQNGYALTVVLEKAVQRLGIPVRFEHRMSQIYREPGGAVGGIRAGTPAGPVDIP